ncbi:MAG: DnaJ domain-containing protein [bacterium]|nr:DnaJ domain-containing protein [bacterium]
MGFLDGIKAVVESMYKQSQQKPICSFCRQTKTGWWCDHQDAEEDCYCKNEWAGFLSCPYLENDERTEMLSSNIQKWGKRSILDAWRQSQVSPKKQRPDQSMRSPPQKSSMSKAKAREILGVSKNDSANEIKKAYHRAASIHHPDKGGSANRFMKVKEAYDTLKTTSETTNG